MVDPIRDPLVAMPPVADLQDPSTPDEEELQQLDQASEQLERLIDQDDSVDSRLALSRLLYRRYEILRDPISLARAIGVLEDLVENPQASDETHGSQAIPWVLAHLGSCYYRHFGDFSDHSSLVRSIDLFREALSGIDDRAESWWVSSNLAGALRHKYELNRRRIRLDEAVSQYRAALRYVDSPWSSRIRFQLSFCLIYLFDDHGELQSLGDADGTLREALEGATDSLRVVILIQLGDVGRRRYAVDGNLETLNEVIEMYEDALGSRVPIDYAAVSANLGGALRARHNRMGAPKDLERAIYYLFTAVDATPRNNKSAPPRALSFSNSLLQRYKNSQFPEEGDLGLAVKFLRETASRCDPGDPHRPVLLATLAEALTLSPVAHNEESAKEALSALRLASSLIPPSSPRRPEMLAQLGRALLRRQSEEPFNRLESVRLLAEACVMTSVDDPAFLNIAKDYRTHASRSLIDDVLQELAVVPRRIVVVVLPHRHEKVSDFSTTALTLRHYLRSLDLDWVAPALDREPSPNLMAISEPSAGELLVDVEPSNVKISALASILLTWATLNSRYLNIRISTPDGDREVSLSSPDDPPKLSSAEGGI